MLALGRHRASFLEGPVGLAILILVCTVAIRLPGDAATSLAVSAIVVDRLARLPGRPPRGDPRPGGRPRAPGGPARRTARLAALHRQRTHRDPGRRASTTTWRCTWSTRTTCSTRTARSRRASSTGIRSGRTAWWRRWSTCSAPSRCRAGSACCSPLPVLTAITSLGALRELPGWRHILGAALVAFAYLTASVLGIAGLQGADRRHVPDRLRAGTAGDRARTPTAASRS